MKFLVIGGAGYIGSHFVYQAIAQGNTCCVYDNLSTGHRQAVHKDAEFLEADLHDEQALGDAIQKFQPDGIFHFAAFALVGESTRNPSKYYHNNVEGVRSLLEVVRKLNVDPVVVFSSSCAVFGVPNTLPIAEGDPKAPISPYGRSKLMAEYLLEDYAHAYGLRAVSLRYFNACGADPSGAIGESHDPETHLIPNILKAALAGKALQIFGNDFPTADGTCIRDYIHVEDLAKGHLLAFEYLNHQVKGSYDVFHLGTGHGASNLEILKAAEKVLGKSIEFQFGERREGDPPSLVAATAKAETLLGFKVNESGLENILASAWLWQQNPKY